MKRKLLLLPAAAALVWSAAFFDFGGRAPVLPPAAESAAGSTALPGAPSRAATAAPSAQPRARAVQAGAPAQEPPVQPPSPHASERAAGNPVVRAARGSVAVIGRVAHALWARVRGEPERPPLEDPPAPAVELTGELAEGVLSPDYTEHARKYGGEPRDGAWAPAQEQRVRALLATQPWANEVTVVNCQQTVCRIMLETDPGATDAFERLLSVPGLREATGIGPTTPYSLRTGELSVYFAPAEALNTEAEHASR